MRLENVDAFEPMRDRVIVSLVKVNTDGGLYLGEDEDVDGKVNTYFGKVEKLGPLANLSSHCSNVDVGDIAIFSQYAGNHIVTADDKGYKLLRGYDIMAKTTDVNDISEKTLTPVSNRVLIEVQYEDVGEDGVVLTAEDSKDPRLADIAYGKVIDVGPDCEKEYKPGTMVAYNPYCGQVLRERTDLETPGLKVLVEDDILMKN